MLAGSLALLLTLAQFPTPRLAEPGDRAEVQAEVAEYDSEAREVLAEGNVSVRSGGIALHADRLVYDLDESLLVASGGITFIDGNVVAFAREGRFSLTGERAFEVRGGEVLVKGLVLPELLQKSGDREALRRTGRNSFVLSAETIRRVGTRRYLAETVRFSPCDCPGREPDWSIVASAADIEPGERALLALPRVYVRGVPVLVLPALYVPLSNRRSGLLLPRPGYSRQNGWILEQPLFLALGQSYDATLTAGYIFGIEEPPTPARVGAQGPRVSGEFRYMPSRHTQGRVFTGLLYDRHRDVDLQTGQYLDRPRGMRGELSWRHQTVRPDGLSGVADVNVVSDGFYLNDAAVDVIRDAPPYLRSQAWFGWRADDAVAFAAGQYYQDLTVNTASRNLFGRGAPSTLQRLPALGFHLARTPVLGRLQAGFDATAIRYQPVAPFAGQESQLSAAPGQLRLDASPTFALPLLDSGPLRAGVYAGARGDLRTAFPEQGSLARALGLAGGYVRTELSRVYGEGPQALRHAIEPRVELRAGSPILTAGAQPGGPAVLDEFDFPAPRQGFGQGIVAVANRLTVRSGARTADLGRIDLGQEV
ncbi:MAG: LPS-assembly protein LptD, partial [Myxococcales bacterium]